jgi:hypothetical protein
MDHKHVKDRRTADLAMIVEMIDESMALAQRKGLHPQIPGCNCMACINKRKRILQGVPQPWPYRL